MPSVEIQELNPDELKILNELKKVIDDKICHIIQSHNHPTVAATVIINALADRLACALVLNIRAQMPKLHESTSAEDISFNAVEFMITNTTKMIRDRAHKGIQEAIQRN